MSEYLDNLRQEIEEKTKRADYIEGVERAVREGKSIEYRINGHCNYSLVQGKSAWCWEHGHYRVTPKTIKELVKEALLLIHDYDEDDSNIYEFLNNLQGILIQVEKC